MTFDYGATMKNLTLTFWPKNFFEVNIHVEKPGKNFGTKSQFKKNDNYKVCIGLSEKNNINFLSQIFFMASPHVYGLRKNF